MLFCGKFSIPDWTSPVPLNAVARFSGSKKRSYGFIEPSHGYEIRSQCFSPATKIASGSTKNVALVTFFVAAFELGRTLVSGLKHESTGVAVALAVGQ